MSDDGIGIHAARALVERLPELGLAGDVVEAETGGFALLELLQGCERAVLVDSIDLPDVSPGTVLRLEPRELPTTLRLRSPHEIDLPTALELGRALGFAMPREIAIIAVQGADLRTFGERLTPPVAAALPAVVDRVVAQVMAWTSDKRGEASGISSAGERLPC